VFKINTAQKVEVVIRTLDGNVVRSLREQRESAAGNYVFLWDGRDDSGDRVAPGLYLAELLVDADSGSAPNRATYMVGMVY